MAFGMGKVIFADKDIVVIIPANKADIIEISIITNVAFKHWNKEGSPLSSFFISTMILVLLMPIINTYPVIVKPNIDGAILTHSSLIS